MSSMDEWHWRVLGELTAGTQRRTSEFVVSIKDRVVLLEWEATVGLWSIPPKTYLAIGSIDEVIARVTAQISNSYLGDFGAHQSDCQSVDLTAEDHSHLVGYLNRFDPQGAELMQLLLDGNKHKVTIGLRPTSDPRESLITRMLSRTWIYNPAAAD